MKQESPGYAGGSVKVTTNYEAKAQEIGETIILNKEEHSKMTTAKSKINRQWCLSNRPVELLKTSDFTWREETVPSPGAGEILVRNIYLSLDPTNRGWVNEQETYLPPVAIGEVMRGIAIGVVEQSCHPSFPEGTIVQGLLGWQDYAITDGTGVTILPKHPSLPLRDYFGVLGHIGLTAYCGLLEIGKPKAGETLVVSAAAGAVGSLVGQIGLIQGCRVVGITGSDEKCHWLTDKLGFDAAINYKTELVGEGLQAHCPSGIDMYFDNVGGPILETVLNLINLRARIILCGMISQYNASAPVAGPSNLINLILKRARIEGFIVLDYIERAQEASAKLSQWLAEGKLQYRLDIVDELEMAPQALNKLFDGSNKGKLLVKVSEEPT